MRLLWQAEIILTCLYVPTVGGKYLCAMISGRTSALYVFIRGLKLMIAVPGKVTLRPRTKDFSNWANPQAVMESELKYYSSLTVGSTILIDYKDSTHALEVSHFLHVSSQKRCFLQGL